VDNALAVSMGVNGSIRVHNRYLFGRVHACPDKPCEWAHTCGAFMNLCGFRAPSFV